MKFQFLPENFSRSENAPPFETRKIRHFEVERIFLKNKKMLQEFSSGSLGHGLPVACGMAMAAKQAKKTHRVFCMVSDGDLNEGSSWEAIMLAGQHRWDNLIMLVDYNRLQALGASEDIIDLEPLAPKLEMFGWKVAAVDGHDCEAIEDVLLKLPLESGRPSAVIFKTVKGKGVSFMENDYKWHYGGLTAELLEQAIKEVEGAE